MALFAFDKAKRRFLLNSRHPGRTADEIQANTGFAYERPDAVPETPGPTAADLAILRGRVTEQLRESYPQFVERLRSERAAAS
jgi:glutaconate CoA-transferase subunit B